MSSTTVHEREAGRNDIGAKPLVQGSALGLRVWEGRPDSDIDDPSLSRDYVASHESVGYVINGRAQLKLEGQIINLTPGSSWLVPPGASHSYHIVEGPFKAIEVTGKQEQMSGGSAGSGGGVAGMSSMSGGSGIGGGSSGIGAGSSAASGHRYIH